MAEALSQSQIDALLAGMSGDEKKEEKQEETTNKVYPKYDFYSPKKFTKEKLNIIKSVYEHYSRVLASRINSLFRVSSEVTIIGVEEERYFEFHNTLFENDTVFVVEPDFVDKFDMSPIVMNTTKSFILSLIDRLLGGTGEDFIDVDYAYAYTEMEMQVCKSFYTHFISGMKDGWSNYLDIDFNFIGSETPHGVLQDIGVDEIVVIVMAEIRIDNLVGQTNICIPATLLSKIFSTMEKAKRIATDKGLNDRNTASKDIFSILKDSSLDVVAKLGDGGMVYMKDIYDLRVGDILNLNLSKETEVDVYVEGNPWFKGKLGVQKKNIAVKVTSTMKNKNSVLL